MSNSDDLLAFRYLAEELSPQEQADFEARLLTEDSLAETLADTAQLLVALKPDESGQRVPSMPTVVRNENRSENHRKAGRTVFGMRSLQLGMITAVFVCGILVGRWAERAEQTGGTEMSPEPSLAVSPENTPATLRESGATIATAWLHLQEQPADDTASPLELGELEPVDLPRELSESDASAPMIPAWLIAAVQSDESLEETEPTSERESEREAL